MVVSPLFRQHKGLWNRDKQVRPPACAPRPAAGASRTPRRGSPNSSVASRPLGLSSITVHGREEVVVVAADKYRRLKREVTGQALIAMLQASPHHDVEIAPPHRPGANP